MQRRMEAMVADGLRAVEEAIDASVGAPPSLDTLADIAGVHPTHLLRTFRRYHGATIANYARQRCVEYSGAEIGRARQPLSAIALDAGISDQAHLTRLFKRAFGVTPGVYARSVQAR